MVYHIYIYTSVYWNHISSSTYHWQSTVHRGLYRRWVHIQYQMYTIFGPTLKDLHLHASLIELFNKDLIKDDVATNPTLQ